MKKLYRSRVEGVVMAYYKDTARLSSHRGHSVPVAACAASPERTVLVSQLERFIHDSGNTLVHLEHPLLARIYVPRPGDNIVQVLCVSENIGCSGMRIHLPCRLDLRPGSSLAIELFVPGGTPIALRGVISTIAHAKGEDIVRYAVDIRFGPLDVATMHDIARFVYTSQLDRQMHLPA